MSNRVLLSSYLVANTLGPSVKKFHKRFVHHHHHHHQIKRRGGGTQTEFHLHVTFVSLSSTSHSLSTLLKLSPSHGKNNATALLFSAGINHLALWGLFITVQRRFT
jgi:hypothetical protein